MRRGIKGLLAAAVAGAAVCAMAGSVSAATYVPKKTVNYTKENGKWVKSYVYTSSYKSGRVVKSTFTGYDSTTGKAYGTNTYEYSYKNGKLTTFKDTYNGKLASKTTYTYKGNKRTKSTQVVYGSGDEAGTFVTTYAYKGSKVSKETTTRNKKAYSTRTYSYKNGRIAKETIKYAAGRTYAYTYSYDKKGRTVKSVTKSSNSASTFTSTITYSKFDKHNNPCKETYSDSDSTSTTTYKYTYNKNGAMAQQISTTKYSDGSTYETKTEYSNFQKMN